MVIPDHKNTKKRFRMQIYASLIYPSDSDPHALRLQGKAVYGLTAFFCHHPAIFPD